MPLREDIKRVAEQVTGYGYPSDAQAKALVRNRKPHAMRFADDGETPNNSRLPVVVYKSPVRLADAYDPGAIFEVLFRAHGWKQSWRDGMYNFNHFHTRTHEVLGIAKGHVIARIGGARGRKLALKAGDVILFPAGTGHRRLSQSRDLLIVGAYPAGGKYDEPTPEDADPQRARKDIAKVRVPARDPVFGTQGPLRQLWKKR